MTNGTSQGLFVVVAIVIFGIFIGLTYTLFGSEGLSNDLENIFTDASEKAKDSLIGAKKLKVYDFLTNHGIGNPYTETSDGVIHLKSDGGTYHGIRTIENLLKPNTEYKMSFDIKRVSGDFDNIGGHLSVSEKIKIYLDGVLVENGETVLTWYNGRVKFPNDTDLHNITVYFDTNNWNSDAVLVEPDKFRSFYIQPSRLYWGDPFEVELSNIEVLEYTE